MTQFRVMAEVSIEDTIEYPQLFVEAVSEDRAIEYGTELLDQDEQYEGGVLLSITATEA